jgi:PAS domain S-box-containing protein
MSHKELKLKNDLLQKKLERYKNYIDNNSSLFISCDLTSDMIIDCSTHFLKIIGYCRYELLKMQIYEIFDEFNFEQTKKIYLKLVNEHDLDYKRVILKKKDGSVLNLYLTKWQMKQV